MKLNLNATELLTEWVNVGPPRNFKETVPENAPYYIGDWKSPASITESAEEIRLQGMLNDLAPDEMVKFLQECKNILKGPLSFSFVDCRNIGRAIVSGLPLDRTHDLVSANCMLDLSLVMKALQATGFKDISVKQWEWGFHVTATVN